MNIFASRMFYLVGGFMAGLVVGALVGIPASLPALDSTPATATASSTMQLPPESGDVAVSNQPAGNTVLVDSVTVPPPGVWVAVEDVSEDGTLGNVLGAAYVRHPASAISVPLLRATLAGQQYAVVLYRDDGDGSFDVAKDSLYIDFNTGDRVEELFKTN